VACGTVLVSVDEPDDLIGTLIDGRFEVIARLGQGGMGTVYRARQRSIGRDIALKLIDRKFETDVGAVKRFFREAKVASQLAHPNTVGVIEFGQGADGRLYLAMELVRGKTLFDVLAESGAMPLARIVKIGVQLCDALEAAHALSIIHRDLKLENVMLLDGGADLIKVLDFGLALSLVDPVSRVTNAGVIAGTPRYLPPEVFDGADPTPAQDIYALGVVLAELAMGRAFWNAPTLEALFAQKLSPRPALDALPPALLPVIEPMIEPMPEGRPPAAEVRATLLAIDRRESQRLAPIPIAVAPTAEVAMPSIGELHLASLDDPAVRVASREPSQEAVPPAARSRPVSFAPSASQLPSEAFAPPASPGRELVLDEAWQREKVAKDAPAPPVKRPIRIGNLIGVGVALLVMAAVVVGVVLVIKYRAPAKPRIPGGGVAIQIVAPHRVEVAIDGHTEGKTPLTLELAKSTTPIVITAPGIAKQVIPDRDQTVDLSLP
jgi:serine/threonine-protein kinase